MSISIIFTITTPVNEPIPARNPTSPAPNLMVTMEMTISRIFTKTHSMKVITIIHPLVKMGRASFIRVLAGLEVVGTEPTQLPKHTPAAHQFSILIYFLDYHLQNTVGSCPFLREACYFLALATQYQDVITLLINTKSLLPILR
jgi:hypothetical protein